ncbi:phosphopantetheine-binding protein [Paenibacillus sp. ACRRX]|uniref:beta-ketoacyl synthase N-terminal-like domain-containing protein n=1 Tax=Paenibacillus sp. ACRRX TaxID=2918206 RepID=UPI001EF5B029|nr:beta-ketoacyl synthase N-terminal-like domain-containing protein [Paenibacillus sp. ACRRX]MCG7407269.1 phosphopantetheine-binding protein [Paenibacillus sp. ACRRX]
MKAAQIIFEHVAAGKMDRATGLQVLKALKLQEHVPNVKDIAVIGVGVDMPQANTLEQFWANIRDGQQFVRPLPLERQQDTRPFITQFTSLDEQEITFSQGGYLDRIDQFDYGFFNLSPKEAALMDPNQRLFLETAWKTIEDAGYGGNRLKGSRTGVYLGYADWPVYGQYISKRQPTLVDMASIGNTPSLIASRISYLLDFKGPAFLVDTACSSSLVAVHLACMALRNGDCDQALTGGVKVCLMPVDDVFAIGIESSNARTSTFDDSSDGTVWGEGTAALLLKPLERAIEDGDRIYAVIKGSAVNQDGASAGITAPNAQAQEQLLLQAWKDAGIPPESITYIEAHGTGTKLGDPIEIDGIQRAFRRRTSKQQFCAVGSVKTNVGHLDSASGIAGLLKAIAALQYKQLPPTLHFTRPNRKISFESSPVYVNDQLRNWEGGDTPLRCGVSSFGFSGTNCHVVLEEAPTEHALLTTNRVAAQPKQELVALCLSAKSKLGIKQLIDEYAVLLPNSSADLQSICYTANTGRGHYGYRLALTAHDKKELWQKLTQLQQTDLTPVLQLEGVYYGEHRIRNVQRGESQVGALTSEELRTKNERCRELIQQMLARTSAYSDGLYEVCHLYTQGADIEWELLYLDEERYTVSVPTYPFQRSRCWLESMTDYTEENRKAEKGGDKYSSDIGERGPVLPDQAAVVSAASSSIAFVKLTGRDSRQYSETEQTIANVWGMLLGITEIDVYDSFFELGGNSIQAIRMEVELERQHVTINSDDLYRFSSITELAAYVVGSSHEAISNDIQEPSATMSVAHTEAAATIAEVSQAEAALVELTDSEMNRTPLQVIIPAIEPFNDVFYKNCFFNSVFPIVRHFGQDPLRIMLNDLILYEYDHEAESGQHEANLDKGYRIRYDEQYPMQQMFKQLNIKVDIRADSSNIVAELIEAISHGSPVVVWVDAYHESIRKDTFEKEHLDHTLLVYGYNEAAQMFHVIEHDRRENLSYKKCVLSFTDLEQGHLGFRERFLHRGHEATHYIFSAESSSLTIHGEVKQPLHAYVSLLNGRLNLLEQSVQALTLYIESFRRWTSDEEQLKLHLDDTITFCNEVINAKHVDSYRIRQLYGVESDTLQSIERIIKKWDEVRKGVVRFLYLPVYKPEVFQSCCIRLQEVVEEERRLTQLLLTPCN